MRKANKQIIEATYNYIYSGLTGDIRGNKTIQDLSQLPQYTSRSNG